MTKQERYDNAHMRATDAYGSLSHAVRNKVGALLVSNDNRPLCCGFNGTSPGTDNECETQHMCPECMNGWSMMTPGQRCKLCSGSGIILKTKPEVHHAERNLLGWANKYGIPTNGCTIYITLSPCVECAKQMELAGIKRVVFKTEYRDLSRVEYLVSRGIDCERL